MARTAALVAALATTGTLTAAGPVAAEIPPSFVAPSSCAEFELESGGGFVRCDDGVPPTGVGGTNPNDGGVSAVTVPAKYGGNGYAGLPPRAADAGSVAGADADGNIALDVQVHYPAGAASPA